MLDLQVVPEQSKKEKKEDKMMLKKNVLLSLGRSGWIANFLKTLVNVLGSKGMTDEEISRLINDHGFGLIRVVADAIVNFSKNTKRVTCSVPYLIFVDYSKSIEEMVLVGNYDRVDKKITSKRFPISRSGKTEMKLSIFHFDYSIRKIDVIEELDKRGYRSAELHEFLAFGAQYPNIQIEHGFGTLGSTWKKSKECYYGAYLHNCSSRNNPLRALDLFEIANGYSRFGRTVAAVPK